MFITYTSIDSEGNTSIVTREVVVNDITAPDITIHGEEVVRLTEGDVYEDLGASAIDNADGFMLVSVNSNVETLLPGWYSVDYSVVDSAGNASTASRSVIVEWAEGVGNALGTLLHVDNSDPEFSWMGHNDGHAYQENAEMVNGNMATLWVSFYYSDTGESYYQYDLTGLPASLGMYEVRMNTSSDVSHCKNLEYEIVDPNDYVLETFYVDHSASELTHNRTLIVGQTMLQQGFKVRINTGISQCYISGMESRFTAWFDQLEVAGLDLAGITPETQRGVVKIDNSDPEFSSWRHKRTNEFNALAVNNGIAGMSAYSANAWSDSQSYYRYSLTPLPEEFKHYEIRMNTLVNDDSCSQVIYEVRDENDAIVQGFTVNHRSQEEGYESLHVGVAMLKRGYSIYLDTSKTVSKCSLDTNWFDELELIEVADQTAPVITLTGAAVIEIEEGLVFEDPGVTVTDNLDAEVIPAVSSNLDMSVPGSYLVTYTATDMSGNQSELNRTVNVTEDVTVPVITLNGDTEVTIDQGTVYVDAGAVANDGLHGAVPVTESNNLNNLVVGSYNVTYNAVDAVGNQAVPVVRTVNVIADQTPPVITQNQNGSMALLVGETFVDPGATANDLFDGSVSVNVSGSVDTAVEGVYQLTYSN